MKSNITRFPEDFMFQVTKDEIPENFSKSQFVTQSEMRLVTAKVSEISVQVAGVVVWKNKVEQKFDCIQRMSEFE